MVHFIFLASVISVDSILRSFHLPLISAAPVICITTAQCSVFLIHCYLRMCLLCNIKRIVWFDTDFSLTLVVFYVVFIFIAHYHVIYDTQCVGILYWYKEKNDPQFFYIAYQLLKKTSNIWINTSTSKIFKKILL